MDCSTIIQSRKNNPSSSMLNINNNTGDHKMKIVERGGSYLLNG